jgi:hypothetical protein
MHKRTSAVLLGTIALLLMATLGCSLSQFVARPQPTNTPTRTPRPTWTPVADLVRVATPTLDLTRFPGVTLPTEPPPTPQLLVPGSVPTIFVPSGPGAPAVQTVVVIIVTATPVPPPTATPGPPTGTPPPTPTPGPPTATPTATNTPLPPVVIQVKTDKTNVRQGPGPGYPLVTKLDAGTDVTVVGRNHDGTWWKICCINGADVWIADAVVAVEGPIWTVPEVTNIPPPPPTPVPPATPTPTPTYAWPFRLESPAQEFPHGQNYLRVGSVIYNGSTPLWGYRLRIRNLATGQTWLSNGSDATWSWDVLQYPTDGKPFNPNTDCQSGRAGVLCLKTNIKWDSNGAGVPMGNGAWEVQVVDRAEPPNALSLPVRFNTSETNSKWYYVVFTNRP